MQSCLLTCQGLLTEFIKVEYESCISYLDKYMFSKIIIHIHFIIKIGNIIYPGYMVALYGFSSLRSKICRFDSTWVAADNGGTVTANKFPILGEIRWVFSASQNSVNNMKARMWCQICPVKDTLNTRMNLIWNLVLAKFLVFSRSVIRMR